MEKQIAACICLATYSVLIVASQTNTVTSSFATSPGIISSTITSPSATSTSFKSSTIKISSATSTSTTSSTITSPSATSTNTTSSTITKPPATSTNTTSSTITSPSATSVNTTSSTITSPSATSTNTTSSTITKPPATSTNTTSSTITSPPATSTNTTSSTKTSPPATSVNTTSSTITSPSATSTNTTSSTITKPPATSTNTTSSTITSPPVTSTNTTSSTKTSSPATSVNTTSSTITSPSATSTNTTSSTITKPPATSTNTTSSTITSPPATSVNTTSSTITSPSATSTNTTSSTITSPSATSTNTTSSTKTSPSTTSTNTSSIVTSPFATSTNTTNSIMTRPSATSANTTSTIVTSPSATSTKATNSIIKIPSATSTSITSSIITSPSATSINTTGSIVTSPSTTSANITSSIITRPSATSTNTTGSIVTRPSARSTSTSTKNSIVPSSCATSTSEKGSTITRSVVTSISTENSIITIASVTALSINTMTMLTPTSSFSKDQKGETTRGSTPTVTNTVKTAMKENAQFKIPFSLSVKKHFTKELMNRSSQIFVDYEKEFKKKILEAFSKKPGYIKQIIIIGFRSGSTICNYEVVFRATVEANNIVHYINTTVKAALQNQTFVGAQVNIAYLEVQMVAEIAKAKEVLSDKCNAENVCPVGYKCLSNENINNLCMDMCHDLNCGKHGTCERSNSTVFCKCHEDADTQYVYGGDKCQTKVENLKLSSKYIAIIAGTVGGGVIFILFIALACMRYRNRRAKATRDGPLSVADQSFPFQLHDWKWGQGMEDNETTFSQYSNPSGNVYSRLRPDLHDLDMEYSSLHSQYGQGPRLPYDNLGMSRTRGYTLDDGHDSNLMYLSSPRQATGGIELGNRDGYTNEPQQVQQADSISVDDAQKVNRQGWFQLPRLTAKSISDLPVEDRTNDRKYASMDQHREESRGSIYGRGNDGRERFESAIRPDKPPRSIENRGKMAKPEVRRYRHDETSSTQSGHTQSSTVGYYSPPADYDDIDYDRRLIDDFEQRRPHDGVRNNAYVAGVDERRPDPRTQPSQRAHHGNEQYYRGSRDR